jgi:uncharacterized protein (DUF849 family)
MSTTNQKVIITCTCTCTCTCTVTGAVHIPSMSEYLPLSPEQITEQSIAAAEAGAAILHLHARDPIDGRPSPDPALFPQFVTAIAQATDAVINITTGGSTPALLRTNRLPITLTDFPMKTTRTSIN